MSPLSSSRVDEIALIQCKVVVSLGTSLVSVDELDSGEALALKALGNCFVLLCKQTETIL